MTKHITFFTFLILLCSNLKGQEILKKSRIDILNFVHKNGGKIDKERQTIDLVDSKQCQVLIASSERKSNQNEIFSARFYLRDNKCYKYTLFYQGLALKKRFIDRFNKTFHLVQNKNNLIWINNSSNYKVEILEPQEFGADSFMIQFENLTI